MLNVEGKVFIAVLAKRISGYFVDNRYIKSSIQKAGITRFSGYVEHTSQLIKEAKEGKNNFAAVWLDLTNGSRGTYNIYQVISIIIITMTKKYARDFQELFLRNTDPVHG